MLRAYVENIVDKKLGNATNNPHDKTLTHDEMRELMNTNYMSCPGGNCGHEKLRSNHFHTDFKSCPECEANTVPLDSNICSTCGHEPQDADEWEDSDVRLQGGD